jgi:hypothetical protein
MGSVDRGARQESGRRPSLGPGCTWWGGRRVGRRGWRSWATRMWPATQGAPCRAGVVGEADARRAWSRPQVAGGGASPAGAATLTGSPMVAADAAPASRRIGAAVTLSRWVFSPGFTGSRGCRIGLDLGLLDGPARSGRGVRRPITFSGDAARVRLLPRAAQACLPRCPADTPIDLVAADRDQNNGASHGEGAKDAILLGLRLRLRAKSARSKCRGRCGRPRPGRGRRRSRARRGSGPWSG